MPVTSDDVRHIARLARLGLEETRVPTLVRELNGILAHMDALSAVDTTGVDATAGVGVEALPLREDAGPAIPLARGLVAFAPSIRDAFIIVPRLGTHEDPTESSA